MTAPTNVKPETETPETAIPDAGTEVAGHARQDVLVTPSWLDRHLHDPGVRVVEVDVSPVSYDDWHIDGAVLWNVYRDLKNEDYRLADKAALEHLLGRSGIDPDSTVVFYGYAPAMGFWLMKLFGHADVRILDCGRATWRAQGHPWSSEVVDPPATTYPLSDGNEQIRAQLPDIERAIGDPACTLLDVRSLAEFRGERFWPSGGLQEGGRSGHIPSAVNVSVEGVLDEGGSFRSSTELSELLGVTQLLGENQTIVYCTIGGRASTAWFVLTYLLNRQGVRVYDGSWAEWGLSATTPVVTG